MRELIGNSSPEEWDGTMMFAGHEWVSRKEVTERFIWAAEEEISIWGVKGCRKIKSKQKKKIPDRGPNVVGKWIGRGIGLRVVFKNQGQKKRCCDLRG